MSFFGILFKLYALGAFLFWIYLNFFVTTTDSFGLGVTIGISLIWLKHLSWKWTVGLLVLTTVLYIASNQSANE